MTPPFTLLGRVQFKDQVFARDGGKCLVCKAPAQDAHHILERRLWTDGGYYLANGAAVCGEHHMEAEQTLLSCDTLRELAKIAKYPLPAHLYRDQSYDKWGNPILPNGQRLRGELFGDESVQKVLAPVLHLFTDRVKYPRTYHLPWSPGVKKDDRKLDYSDLVHLASGEIVITVKMDGENTTMGTSYMHARSVDYDPHPSRSWAKALHSRIAFDIPPGWRVCGENLFAKHSIEYKHLEDYFLVFSVWNDKNECLSWDETLEWTALLGLKTVPVMYRGPWLDPAALDALHAPVFAGDPCEGYVIRTASQFSYREFRQCVAKYVRADHVQTHGHWMRSRVEPNKLRGPHE
jgi:hypothetical protein